MRTEVKNSSPLGETYVCNYYYSNLSTPRPPHEKNIRNVIAESNVPRPSVGLGRVFVVLVPIPSVTLYHTLFVSAIYTYEALVQCVITKSRFHRFLF